MVNGVSYKYSRNGHDCDSEIECGFDHLSVQPP